MNICRPTTGVPGRSARLRASAVLAVGAGLVLALGCGRDEVSHSTVTAPGPAPMGAPAGAAPAASAPMQMPPQGAMPPAGMPPAGMPPAMPEGQVPTPPRPSGSAVLKWTLPKGWTETPGSGMRFATLVPPGGGKVEASVIVLPGAAGGELANVNRWRGQIGLGPLDQAGLTAARKAVKSKAGEVAVYDFTSEGGAQSRVVTGLLTTTDGNTWFLKLMGDAEPVGKAKPGFLRFLETLRLG